MPIVNPNKQTIHRLREFCIEIVFLWVPSHVGIQGNSVVDRVAKKALNEIIIKDVSLPYTDFKPLIRKYILKMWQDRWDGHEHNKLNSIKPDLGIHQSGSAFFKRANVSFDF